MHSYLIWLELNFPYTDQIWQKRRQTELERYIIIILI